MDETRQLTEKKQFVKRKFCFNGKMRDEITWPTMFFSSKVFPVNHPETEV